MTTPQYLIDNDRLEGVENWLQLFNYIIATKPADLKPRHTITETFAIRVMKKYGSI